MAKSQDVINFRRRLKIALVKSFGNKCQVCGISYPQSVYDFHHLNPAEKEFGVGAQATTHSKADTAREAKKCIMVCANCHRLIEHEDLDINGIVCAFDEDVYYSTLDNLIAKNKEDAGLAYRKKSRGAPSILPTFKESFSCSANARTYSFCRAQINKKAF